MKHTHFRIQNGSVVKCSPFDSLSGAIRANTKAEAIARFLARAETVLANPPSVYVCNGAFLILSPSSEGFTTESGTLPVQDSTVRRLNSSCIATHKTLREAQTDKSFAYYASAEYQSTRANQIASLAPERIKAAQDAQTLSTLAETAESANARREIETQRVKDERAFDAE